ncbi:Hypothetical protein EHI5A_266150 [Entamoeba histolytica KU27]|uniref:Uncharacterized protein n=1 Tax=Entamoeba histolytica KU27 TaxID=885311 RepID=M2PZT5_ENTHI|nr:Hypothetical protein EHI5A_266150 [Entamoeba histolytica KU27]
MSIISTTTKQETLIRKDELNKNTFKVTVNTNDITIETTTNGITTFTSENYIDRIQLINQVPEPKIQTKAVTITENGSYTITPDDNLDALDYVYVTTNVPQYKIDSIKIYNNGNKLATVATEIIYITEDTDITDLIPADGNLHKVVTTSTGNKYIKITKKENCQFILFRLTKSDGLFIYEMEIEKTFIIYNYLIYYILKLNTESPNTGLIRFCKGTTIEEAIKLISYDSENIGSETINATFKMSLNSSLLSENFPIK